MLTIETTRPARQGPTASTDNTTARHPIHIPRGMTETPFKVSRRWAGHARRRIADERQDAGAAAVHFADDVSRVAFNVAFRSAKGLHSQIHSFRGAKGDNGRVCEPGGCCVIVAFRSAKADSRRPAGIDPSR